MQADASGLGRASTAQLAGRSILFTTTRRCDEADSPSNAVSSLSRGLRPIQNQQDQIRDRQRTPSPRHPLALHRTGGFSYPGRIDERHRDPLDIGDLRHQVARRPRNVSDDRARCPTR